MKWNAKPSPKEGDVKQKTKFALFPTLMEDKWIWLESYIQFYIYEKYLYTYDVVVSEGILTEKYKTEIGETIGWVKTDKKLITKQ